MWVVFHYTRYVAGQAPDKYPTSTTQVANLIAAIGDGTYSVSEMMEKLQLNNRRYFTKEYLKIAVMEGCRTIVSIQQFMPRKPDQGLETVKELSVTAPAPM